MREVKEVKGVKEVKAICLMAKKPAENYSKKTNVASNSTFFVFKVSVADFLNNRNKKAILKQNLMNIGAVV